ncbi:GTP 3',8-cyclase MoaA [Pedobacter sp. MW01-1-1]|uniref:GTP 3',8-cyclase MoaA n=1 Tax=Pedobacter sp. MW01-1-1 TaxID=3383027 RepID=UPI003FF054AB
MIVDENGRSFKTLRLSLLSACNLACVYCTDEADLSTKGLTEKTLSVEGLLEQIANLHRLLNLECIRLTGGEPLLYTELERLIAGIKEIGIPNIKMTSNGFLLERKAKALKLAGLQEINISLDAADEGTFFKMTKRTKFLEVQTGIDAAIACGLRVKINSVIMRNQNEHQIIPLLDFCWSRGLTIRFLEVMAMGHLHGNNQAYLYSQKDILKTIASKYRFEPMEREKSATANYWQTAEGAVFGIIANHSQPFCGDCNRLRLDNKGNIYGCLSENNPISMMDEQNDAYRYKQLQAALQQKQKVAFTGSDLSMLAIGG